MFNFIPKQGVFDEGDRVSFNLWTFVFHRFPELDNGFLPKNRNILTEASCENEEVCGWKLAYEPIPRPELDDFITKGESFFPTKTKIPTGCSEGEKYLWLPDFPRLFKGIWIGTNPLRRKVIIIPVPQLSAKLLGLRKVAGILARRHRKIESRIRFLGGLMSLWDSVTASGKILQYIASQAKYRHVPPGGKGGLVRSKKRDDDLRLGSGEIARRCAEDWRRRKESA